MNRKSIEFTLRPATLNDIEFIYELRTKTMKPYFEGTLGWSEALEREKAADELTNAEIVIAGQKRVGVIKVIPKTDELHLHQMQILPEFQKKGIGAELVRRTISRSEQSCKPITLFVVNNTPAKRLYERFGFVVTNDFEQHCRMCRQPSCDEHSVMVNRPYSKANSGDAKKLHG
jgi:ribosomal protein S18 acetylase RimI-like enzyme